MFLGYWIIFFFLFGLPISFGIGVVIGLIVYRILDAKTHKMRTLVLSGLTYIVSQPISYVAYYLVALLIVGMEPSLLLVVPFAIIFTTTISIILVQASKRSYVRNQRKKHS